MFDFIKNKFHSIYLTNEKLKLDFFIGLFLLFCSVLLCNERIINSIINLGELIAAKELTRNVWYNSILEKRSVLFILSFFFLLLRNIFHDIPNNFDKNNLTPLLLFSLYIFGCHFFVSMIGDDPYFSTCCRNTNICEWLNTRYLQWSSRLLIETLLVSVLFFKINWFCLFNSIVVIYVVNFLLTNTNVKRNRKYSWIPIIFFSTMPISLLSNAGWAATSINYLWPLAASLPFYTLIIKIFRNVKCDITETITSLILFTFGCNQEQICMLNLGLVSFLSIMYYLRREKQKKHISIFISGIVISAFSILFIFNCPGNRFRIEEAIILCFPNFNQVSPFVKLEIGFINIFSYYFGFNTFNLVIVPILFVLTFNSVKTGNNKFLAFSTDMIISILFLIKFTNYFGTPEVQNGISYTKTHLLIETIVFLFLFLSIIYQVYTFSPNRMNNILNSVLLVAGFCSAIILSFSPTVITSSIRTLLFFNYLITFVASRMFFEIAEEKPM